jgi:hypothetical protein
MLLRGSIYRIALSEYLLKFGGESEQTNFVPGKIAIITNETIQIGFPLLLYVFSISATFPCEVATTPS